MNEVKAQSKRVGPWAVEVGMDMAVVEDTRNGDLHSAAMYRFPIGWRVGKVWSNGLTDTTDFIPKRVIAAANALANKLTKEN